VTQEQIDMTRMDLQAEDWSHVLFGITEVLSAAVVLVIILVLLFAWQRQR
jgi:hypothetical protein